MTLRNRLDRVQRTADRERYIRQLEARVAELEAQENEFADMTDAEVDAQLELIDRRLAEARKGRAEPAA
jgi:hypothetical protein